MLGENYEHEIRALVDGKAWYRNDIGIEEVFNLWIARSIESALDASWIFEPLRVSERKFLCEHFGIARPEIIGKSPRELAERLLQIAGLPVFRMTGNRAMLESWQHLLSLVNNDDDDRAAVAARQRAERVLRKILFFYCATGYSEEFIRMLENPGTLRVPQRLATELKNSDLERRARITNLFTEDGWADLGFLALALRKFSERLLEAHALHVSGAQLKLYTAQEHEAFNRLGSALQPYTHDRPSKQESKKQDLRDALLEIVAALTTMIARGVVPDEALVIETGISILGAVFKISFEAQTSRYFRSSETPPVGSVILVLSSTNCDYASCNWVASPW
ncbi:hypothetical protein [Occallatibacter savannae]|uniref:hypothetical protein n=1 Tax=Occallatibacter savannae TaxID=1002691 RepID=UPI0013A5A3EB|nr:hypothetical protein [Occallatibacter savannae]